MLDLRQPHGGGAVPLTIVAPPQPSAILGVVPEPAHALDPFSIVTDQYVVQGDDTLLFVVRRGIALQPLEASGMEGLGIPIGLREKPVEARLVGGVDELGLDAADGFLAATINPVRYSAK